MPKLILKSLILQLQNDIKKRVGRKNMDKKVIALVGNPNVGKTVLFNSLTDSFERVGNWHGVTVDKKIKTINYKKSEYKISTPKSLFNLQISTFPPFLT